MHAPGVGVLSASSDSDTASEVRTGTSMAAPYVTGTAALYMEQNPVSPPPPPLPSPPRCKQSKTKRYSPLCLPHCAVPVLSLCNHCAVTAHKHASSASACSPCSSEGPSLLCLPLRVSQRGLQNAQLTADGAQHWCCSCTQA